MNIIEEFPVSKPLLSSFSEEDLARLSVVTYPAKTIIVTKGRILNTIYFILNGSCSVMKDLPNGNTIIGYHISTLNHIGLNGILSQNSRCFSTIISVTDLTVLQMSKSDFLYFHHKYPSFALFLLQQTSTSLHKALQISNNCKSHTAGANILYYLSQKYEIYAASYPESYDGFVKIDESRQQMSDFLNLTVRSLTRYITQFKEQHLLTINKGKIHISRRQYEAISALLESDTFT